VHLDELLFAIVLVLAVVAVSVSIFKRLGLGAILGYIVAGLIVGPSGFMVTDKVDELLHVTEIGVVLLLFIIGLEMQPGKLWSMRRAVFGLGSAQVLVTAAAIAAIMLAVVPAMSWETAIIIGFGFALSSTAFVMQMLGERNELQTRHGEASFSILLLQDIAIVPLLALVPFLAGTGSGGGEGHSTLLKVVMTLGSVAVVLGIGRYGVPLALDRSSRAGNSEAFMVIAMLAALGAAWVMEVVGLSMALGAFLMGMMISDSEHRHQVETAVKPFQGTLIALFFIAVGMSINLGVLFENVTTVLGLTVSIILIKMAILFLLALGFGLERPAAVRVATILPQCGEFGFVLFGAAKVTGMIDELPFTIALLTISVSMALTPLIVGAGNKLASRLESGS
jgi:glutathione-regulated potassium-efflux system protein KefB